MTANNDCCDQRSANDAGGESSNELNGLLETENQETEEYEALNAALDQISSCLDAIEEQNDALNAQLRELLESSRQTRREMQESARNDKEKSSL